MVWSYFLGLVTVLALAFIGKGEDFRKVGLVLFMNWAACLGYAYMDGGFETVPPPEAGANPVILFAIDYTAAVLLAIWSQTRVPLIVVGFYGVQCIAHGAKLSVPGSAFVTDYYLDALSWTAWLQLIFAGGWMSGTLLGLWGRNSYSDSRKVVGGPVPASVASKDASR